MHKPHRHLWQFGALLLPSSLVLLLWWLSVNRETSAPAAPETPLAASPGTQPATPPPQMSSGPPDASAPATADDDASVQTDFRRWLEEYHGQAKLPEDASVNASLISQGRQLAEARKIRMARLMKSNPEQAMREAVSFNEYAGLPETIRSLVEKPFSAKAGYTYIPVCTPPGQSLPSGAPDHFAELELEDGSLLVAYSYGRRAAVSSKRSLPVQGIMLDGAAAMHDSVFRELSPAEIPVAETLFPPGQPDLARSFATGQPIAGASVTAISGGLRFSFANRSELQSLNEALANLDDLPGPNAGSMVVYDLPVAAAPDDAFDLAAAQVAAQDQASVWTETTKKVFLVRVDFSDYVGAPYTKTQVDDNVNITVSNQIEAMSYGKTSIQATVSTNTYRMPQSGSFYADKSNGNYGSTGFSSLNTQLLRDARNTFRNTKSGADAAINIGPVATTGYGDSGGLGNYDIVGLVFTNIGAYGSGVRYSGLGSLGGAGLWIQGTNSSGTYTHEFGHNYGVDHANFWRTSDGTVTGTGSNVEYGDSFDIMGGGGLPEGHFHPQAKAKLNWLTTSEWTDATAGGAGTYRVYRCDDAGTIGSPRGLRITKASSPAEYYWVGYRPAYTSNSHLQNGAYLIWQRPGETQCWLLDTTPATSGVKSDAPVAVGVTYVDTAGPIYITPVATGGSGSECYIDVRVEFNAPGNRPPTVNPIVGPSTVAARTSVTFTASATDPDGNSLIYVWDAGDGSATTSGSSKTYSWAVGGTYTLTLTVNDLKGGRVTVTKTITVTDPTRLWTQRSSGTTNDLNAITANATTAVAMGDRGRVLTSADGITWSPQTVASSTNIYFHGIAWNGTRFIAVGEDYNSAIPGWVGVIYTSPDGATWTRVFASSAAATTLRAVATSGEVNVAVGDNATVLRSADGVVWSPVTVAGVGVTESLTGAAYGGGTFTFTSNTSDGVKVLTSTNGTTWVNRSSGSGLASWQTFEKIAWLNDRFAASGWYSKIRVSTNGAQTFTTTRTNSENTPALAYGEGVFFAAGVDLSAANADVDVHSADGVNWFSFAAPTTANRNAAAFFRHRFITVGDGGEIWQCNGFLSQNITVEQPAGTFLQDGISSVSFGSVLLGGNQPLVFTIQNTGTTDITGVNITTDGANAADFAITSPPAGTIAPGSRTSFTVQFTPGALGARNAAIHIASSDASAHPFDIPVSGIGVTPEIAVYRYAGAELADGSGSFNYNPVLVGSSASQTFSLWNHGTAPLTGVSITKDGAGSGDFTITASPSASVNPNASTTFTVTFNPSAIGSRSALIHIASNDLDENPYDIVLNGTGAAKAEMIAPVPGTTLTGTNVSFNWDTGTGITSYQLYVGNSPGAYDLYRGTAGTSLTQMANLPDDGRTIYVTLWSLISGVWHSNSYTFEAFTSVKAQITSPPNGSTLTSTSLPLTWNAGAGVTRYDLYVGTTVGGKEIYSGNQGTALSRTVIVPATGAKVYVTLWSLTWGGWLSSTYVFTSPAPVRATLTAPSPANGSSLANGNLNLAWNPGLGVTGYSIYVGSTVGGRDIATRNVSAATTTQSIPVPLDGGPIYVTLWSQINGAWQSESYWCLTAPPLSGNVAARLTSPPNTSTLGATTETFTWDAGTGVTRRDLWFGSSPDGYDLYKGANEPALTRTPNNLPGDGRRIYVTLHSLVGGVWQSNAYYFTAVTSPSPQAAQLLSPANGTTLASASLPLIWGAAVGATRYDLYLGSTPMTYDLYKGNEALNTARTVTVPTDGRPIYLTLWSLINGAWLQNSYGFTTANTAVGNQRALMTSPANGSVLPGSTATFDWDTGTGVGSYSLYVGTTPGGRELYSATSSTIRSRTLTTLPTDGRKIYVTLWSKIGTAWQSNSYLYTAANIAGVKAEMLTPAPGSTFTSATVIFNWSAGTGTQYWLQIGRTPGSSNLYAGDQGANLTKTLTTMPTDGSPIYVKLQSLINGTWQTNEYIYQAALPP